MQGVSVEDDGDGVLFRAPKNENFNAEIKRRIPADARDFRWDRTPPRWWIRADWRETAAEIAERHFGVSTPHGALHRLTLLPSAPPSVILAAYVELRSEAADPRAARSLDLAFGTLAVLYPELPERLRVRAPHLHAGLTRVALPRYESIDIGTLPVELGVSRRQIRHLLDTGAVTLHQAILPEPDAHKVEQLVENPWESGGYREDCLRDFGELGEHRFVREPFAEMPATGQLAYRADFDDRQMCVPRWSRPTRMRVDQARLLVELCDVSVHRLQDLPDADYGIEPGDLDAARRSAREEFGMHWDLATRPGEPMWQDNPWVWRVGYRLARPVVRAGRDDEMAARRPSAEAPSREAEPSSPASPSPDGARGWDGSRG